MDVDAADARAVEFDVFLSYNREDREAVAALVGTLRDREVRAWWDRTHVVAGRQWMPQLAAGLEASSGCAVIVGPHGLGDWVREELAVAQDRAAKDPDFAMFMVLLPGAVMPSDASLAFLKTRGWVDLRDEDGIEALVAAIRGTTAPGAIGSLDRAGECPYRGLAVFDEEHAEFFFGRDDDTASALEKLRGSRFLPVLGASGSGKSSLVRAGIVPALRDGGLPGSDKWHVRVLTPGTTPLTSLAAQLLTIVSSESMQRTVDGMREDERTLDLAVALALAREGDDARVLLVIDQFEEVFTLCGDEEERNAFLDNVLHAATVPAGRTVVIAAMRADFYHRYAESARLRRLLADGQLLVGPLDAAAVREVIEKPAARVGLKLEDGLADLILRAVEHQPGGLPLIEHVLLELWRRRTRGTLTIAAYRESGGVEEALARRAESTYVALSPEEQQLATHALLRLVQPHDDAEDTRRRATIDELVTEPAQTDQLRAVVQALADERLLSLSNDPVTGVPVVELAHEALIREWPRLSESLVEQHAYLRERRRLAEAALDWERDPTALLRGAPLARWKERGSEGLNPGERAFLEASWRAHEAELRAARRVRRALRFGGVGAMAVIAAVAVAALLQARRANDERKNASDALARQYAVTAEARLGHDPQEAVRLAGNSLSIKPTRNGEAVLRAATAAAFPSTVLRGHAAGITDVSFSPDRRRVVSASFDKTVRVWTWHNRRERPIVWRLPSTPEQARFALDGGAVYTRSDDGRVRLWDVKRPKQPAVTAAPRDISAVALATDQRRLLLGGATNAYVWDLARPTAAPVQIPERHDVSAVRWANTGNGFATGDSSGVVRVWSDIDARPRVFRASTGVTSVAFSPDDQHVVAVWHNGDVRVLSLSATLEHSVRRSGARGAFFTSDGTAITIDKAGTDVALWNWRRHGARPVPWAGNSMVYFALQQGGPLLAYGEAGGTVRVWDIAHPDAPALVMAGHVGVAGRVQVARGGREIVSGGLDGTVRVWQPTAANPRSVVTRALDPTHAAVISGDGRRVVATNVDKTRVYGSRNGPVDVPGDWVTQIAISGDGSRLATMALDDQVTDVWDVRNAPTRVARLESDGPVESFELSSDGRQLVALDDDDVVIWDIDQGSVAHKRLTLPRPADLTLGEYAGGLAFSRDGDRLAAVGVDGTLVVWDLNRPEAAPATQITGESATTAVDFEPGDRGVDTSRVEGAVQFAPDGRHVAVGRVDGAIDFADLATHRSQTLRGGEGKILSVSIAADARFVLGAGDAGDVFVWDLHAPSMPPTVLAGTDAWLMSASFVAGTRQIVTVDEYGVVRRWDCRTCGPLAAVRAMAGRRSG